MGADGYFENDWEWDCGEYLFKETEWGWGARINVEAIWWGWIIAQ